MFWPEEEEKEEKNFQFPMKRNLTKPEKIKKSGEFKNIFKKASNISCRGAKCFFINNDINYSRFAVTLTRKYGNSVNRNRAKRQLREIIRLNKEKIKKGKDIIFILYPGDYTYKDREDQFLYLIKRAELIVNT